MTKSTFIKPVASPEEWSGQTTPFQFSSGPKTAKIALVGEAWGKEEASLHTPFVGSAGQELTRILRKVGISRTECYMTNVLPLQPPGNNIDSLCVKKGALPKDYGKPQLSLGQFIHPNFLPELERLKVELETVKPNLIVALGNVACWAVLNQTKISALRGTTSVSTLVPGIKTLPTYHPAAILRNWVNRPVLVADLQKAKREMEFPEIRRPKRLIYFNPTVADCWHFFDRLKS